MKTAGVHCPELGCMNVIRVPRSLYSDSNVTKLTGLVCPAGHRFDFDRSKCPRCGHDLMPQEWRRPQAFVGSIPPELPRPIFYPARCSRQECGYEGPRSPEDY
jgi:hypothetical protein